MDPYIYVLSVNGLIFILSIVFYKFPPKKINSLYGYRTHKSMLNQDIWDYANAVFTKALLMYAAICFAAAMALTFLNPEMMQSWVPMGLMALTLLVSIVKTEQSLKATFDDEGRRK